MKQNDWINYKTSKYFTDGESNMNDHETRHSDEVIVKQFTLNCLWFLPSIFTLIFIFIYYLPKEPDFISFELIPHYARIQLFTMKYNRYIREYNKNLVALEDFPWMHGATFEVYKEQPADECFKLRSMSHRWLRLNAGGQLVADGAYQLEGTYFSALPHSHYTPVNRSISGLFNEDEAKNSKELQKIVIKVCHSDLWFEVRPSIASQLQAEQAIDSLTAHQNENLMIGLRNSNGYGKGNDVNDRNHRRLAFRKERNANNPFHIKIVAGMEYLYFKLEANLLSLAEYWLQLKGPESITMMNESKLNLHRHLHSTSYDIEVDKDESTVFGYKVHKPIHGVNLGGWFIPEVWMVPQFFAGTGLGWSGSLCRMVNYSRSLTEQRIQHTLKHWIIEQDFKEIASIGFDSVRLPIGYWNVIEDPYHLYAPANLSLSLSYIDFTFAMALQYNLTVVLDLHGAPGSQNGIDHSGCGVPPKWSELENYKLSLDAVEVMVLRYGKHPSLLGIELLNEPSQYYSENNHSALLRYYEEAYRIIRRHQPKLWVIFNELYVNCFIFWKHALQEPDYYNVIVDWHLYNWQGPFNFETKAEHIQDAKNWEQLIDDYSTQHPVIIGEWCMSTGTMRQVGQAFVDSCVNSFDSRAFGSYLWNWKIQRGVHFDEWDVQYQYRNPKGLRPLKTLSKP